MLKPTAWVFYLIIVFEIVFMISPFALHFYSAYGRALNFMQKWPATTWLTKFYLPHFSKTSSPILNALPELSWVFILTGLMLFLAGHAS